MSRPRPRQSACPCGSGRPLADCCRGPDFAARFGQAISFHQGGQLDRVGPLYDALLNEQPDHPDLLHYRGLLAYQRGELAAALDWLAQAVARRPQAAAFRVNFGHALKAAQRPLDALAQYETALGLEPQLLAASYGRARQLRALGRGAEALAELDGLLRRQPGFAAGWGELAALLQELEQIDQAEAAYRRQLDLDPQQAGAWCALAEIALRFGEHAAALALYGRAEQVSAPASEARLVAETGRLFCLAYTEADGAKILAAHRAWADQRPLPAAPPLIRHRHDRLQLAFLSGDWRGHAMRFFARPLLKNYDRRRFSVSVYSTLADPAGDQFTTEFRAAAEHWVDLAGQSDQAAAAAMQQRGIDVLIDLSGFTAGNRLGLLERRPAAVQGHMLGYMTTSGMPAIDFRLSDRTAVPESAAAWFSEKLLWLPDSQWCYVPDADPPALTGLPARVSRSLTLGAFHNAAKLNPEVLALYARALQQLPSARLRLVIWGQRPQQRLAAFFAAAGVGDRVEFLPPRPYRDYLAYYHELDLSLDTFPYAGGTVSCESLWMGVPVLSLAHPSPAGRGGASILSAAGLGDWVADSAEDWLARLQRLTGEPAGLAEVRAGLRQRLLKSALMDVDRYMRGFESVLSDYFSSAAGARR